MTSVVAARNVSYAVRGTLLIRDISFELLRGQLTAVIGPNGAGKSTLLRALAGELRCHTGSVVYGGQDVRLLTPWQLATRRAVMAQASRLAFPFSVWEVASLGIDGLGRRFSHSTREGFVAKALEQAEVGHLAGRIFQSLSGGEQQRVQFARALTQLWGGRVEGQDQALFLDEPTAHLDLSHQLMLMDQVRDLTTQGIAVLVTLHDLNLAAAYADRIAVLSGGRLVAQGRPNEVLTDELVAAVFGIACRIGELPPAGAAFILPHGHASRTRI